MTTERAARGPATDSGVTGAGRDGGSDRRAAGESAPAPAPAVAASGPMTQPGGNPPGGPGIPAAARCRVVIEGIVPQVDGGRFPAKSSLGEAVVVEADVFADGHDLLACELRYRHDDDRGWSAVPMSPLPDDRWRARFVPVLLGPHRFQIRAVIDRFGTWRRDLLARADAGQEISVELVVGADLLVSVAERARGEDRRLLRELGEVLRGAVRGLQTPTSGGPTVRELLTGPQVSELVARHLPMDQGAVSPTLAVVVDPARARHSCWYEVFPRSAGSDGRRHGTFADVVGLLPYLTRLGVDTLYLPPVHPIGWTNRKGRDGAPEAGPGDPGSPWAIGSADGGHTAVHPELGTLTDFERLVAAFGEVGIDVALDLAFQCSPDHPWVAEHPQWFRHLPDGSIRHAENPPKRYEDIYPIDFETEDWEALWRALLLVVQFWIDHGVTVFRVDNPHTKSLGFWEWLIATVKAEAPEVVFLSEAFTRPKVMRRLAKAGFSQSYTYFTWRNHKWELVEYLTELTRRQSLDYFRPNFWPNTPDILTEALQHGGTATFMVRLVLAATMAASYGIYGPPFELQEHVARSPGSEEYLRSEKYEIRQWDVERPDSLGDFVARVNRIRRDHRALHYDRTLRFHAVDNDALIAYSKTVGVGDEADTAVDHDDPGAPVAADAIVVVANLDPRHAQSGWVELDLASLGLPEDRPFVAHDLLTDAHYSWAGRRNFVLLDPEVVPAHVLAVRHPDPAGAR